MVSDYTPARPLMAHQQEALSRMAGQESFALLCEFGTGKSAVIVADAGRLFPDKIDGVLILAPKGVYSDWGWDNPETSHWRLNTDPELLKKMRVVMWRGGQTKKQKEELGTLLWHPGLAVLAMNTEALSASTRAYDVAAAFLRARRCMLVVDESTMIKSPGSRRTKRATALADLAQYRRILTGFPTPRSSLDLYAQFRVLDWRILGHKSFFTYRNRYAVMQPLYLGSRTVQQVVGYRNTEELWSRIEPHSFRVRADDCLDLPEAQYRLRSVEMPSETLRVYEDLKRQATSEVGDGQHVSATLAITLIMKLHQVACGFVRTEDGLVQELPCRKGDELLELIEEIGEEEKVVIWSHFRHGIQTIADNLSVAYGPDSVVCYFGDTSDSERLVARDRFANDPRCRFFVGSQMAGGRGLNDLVVARHAVFWSNPPDLELRLNAEARTRRKGSERHTGIIYHDLVTSGSVEERIVRGLRAKLDLAALVLQEGVRSWLI